MARIIINSKGFKVVKTKRTEMVTSFGGYGICDHCNQSPIEGYYVAVLNHWLCESCYTEWTEMAVNYTEDQPIENRNFEYAKNLLTIEK